MLLIITGVLAAAAPGIWELWQRTLYDVRGQPGDARSVEIDVVAPTLPGLLDIVLLLDQTGSYAEDLPFLRDRLPPLVTNTLASETDLRFGLVGFQTDPAHYFVHLPLGDNYSGLRPALQQMTADGGGEEIWIHAIDQVLDDFEFRDRAAVVLLLATDEPSAYVNEGDEEQLAARLANAEIRLVGLVPAGETLSQVNYLAAATEGTVEDVAQDSSDIEHAVVEGLENLPADLFPMLDPGCPVRDVTFSPAEVLQVEAGRQVPIEIDFIVASGYPAGDVVCTVRSAADSEPAQFVVRVDEER